MWLSTTSLLTPKGKSKESQVVNLEIILRGFLVDILRALSFNPDLPLFTDDRRYDAGHTALPGMRPLPE
jgi:hypothetical protein